MSISAGPAPRCRPELLPRLAVVASIGCLVAHLALLATTRGAMLTMTLSMLALSLVCATCSLRTWRRRCSDTELTLMSGIGLCMVTVHLAMSSPPADGAAMSGMSGMSGMPGMAMSGARGGGPVPGAADLLMHGGFVLALAAAVLAGITLVRRGMAAR